MLYKTKGIVLNYIRYSDTSIITKIYTENFGIQTYIVNNVRSKSSKNKIALFQPLTLLDLVVYHKETKEINRISEIKCNTIYQSIPFNQKKISIAFFIAEILTKTLKEQHGNAELFEFIFNTIAYLDVVEDQFENTHIIFTIQLTAYLGFAISDVDALIEETKIQLTIAEKDLFKKLIESNIESPIRIDRETKNKLLGIILKYYAYHIENFGTLNSIAILQEIFK